MSEADVYVGCRDCKEWLMWRVDAKKVPLLKSLMAYCAFCGSENTAKAGSLGDFRREMMLFPHGLGQESGGDKGE